MAKKCVILFVLLLILPVSASSECESTYIVIVDSHLTIEGINTLAEYHKACVIYKDLTSSNVEFSDIKIISPQNILIVCRYQDFNRDFVKKIYSLLDFDENGVYDISTGFYPVQNEESFLNWVNSLTTHEYPEKRQGLFITSVAAPRDECIIGELDSEEYTIHLLDGTSADADSIPPALEAADFIWMEGHGSPYSVDLERYGFNYASIKTPEGTLFVFESCDVGCIWRSQNSLVLSLLSGGARAVVASLDMGGVGVLDGKTFFFTTPTLDLGKVVLIQNHYFVSLQISSYPKAVLFGDPSTHTFHSDIFTVEKKEGVYTITDRTTTPEFEKILLIPHTEYSLFPQDNNNIFIQYSGSGEFKESLFSSLKYLIPFLFNTFSIISLWDSVVTSIFFLYVIVAFFILLKFRERIIREKTLTAAALLSALITLLILITVDRSTEISALFRILVLFCAASLTISLNPKKDLLTVILFFISPVGFLFLVLKILDLVTSQYALFALGLCTLTALIISLLLFGLTLVFYKTYTKYRTPHPP